MSDFEVFDADDFDAEACSVGVVASTAVFGGAWLARLRKKREEEEEYILL